MLNILTYNTHLFGGTALDLLPGIGGSVLDLLPDIGDAVPQVTFEDQERLDAIIRFLKSSTQKADVIGLTEVWANDNKDHIIDTLRSKYPYSFYEDSNISELGSGLLLLSRFPLSETGFENFQHLTGADKASQKGIINARVSLPDHKTALIFLSHVQAGESDEDKMARKNNIRQIRDRIRNIEKEFDKDILLIGDLNIVGEDASGKATSEYQEVLQPLLEEVGLQDLFRSLNLDTLNDPGFTYDGPNNNLISIFAADEANLRQRLDYIFTSSIPLKSTIQQDLTYHSTQEGTTLDASDHYPLTGVVDVTQVQEQGVPLQSNYAISVKTANQEGAGTDQTIFLTMWGENGKSSDEIELNKLLNKNVFERGNTDTFNLERTGLGRITKIKIRHGGGGSLIGGAWDLESVQITNPDGFLTIFNYNTTLSGGEDDDKTIKNAEGFPQTVSVEMIKNSSHSIPQIYSMENAGAKIDTHMLQVAISGEDQVQISKETVRGNTLPEDLSYGPLTNQFPNWSKEVRGEWEKVLVDKRIMEGKRSFEVVETKAIELPADSLKFVETNWETQQQNGMVKWGERRYGLNWMSQKPTLGEIEEFTYQKEGADKIPYRFKQHLKESKQSKALSNYAGRFKKPPAFSLDGTNDFATANAVCSQMTNTGLAFGCWAKPAMSDNQDGTLMAFNTASGSNCNMIGYDAVRKQFFYFDPENSYRWSGGHFEFDRWYHVFISIDANNKAVLYLDGEAMIRFETKIRPDTKGRFSIGQEWDTNQPSDFFKGLIADIRIWNQHLNSSTIRAQRLSRLTGKEKDLAAYWPVAEEKGNILYDKVKEQHATIIGGQWILDTDLPMD